MSVEMDAIRKAMFLLLDNIYPELDLLKLGRYTVEDIIDQVIMLYIIKDYQLHAERKSIRQHRYKNGMVTQYDDASYAQRYNRLIEKTEYYKQYNREQLWKSVGIHRIELSHNDMSGASNWQNAYSLTDTEFHELTMQDECKLLKKILEHKISSKNSVPNPMFKELFAIYEAKLDELFSSMDMSVPESVIAKTSELFNLQWKYNIELFYQITLDAEKYVFQIEIPYQRIAFLCCQVPVIPATDWLPLEIRGAENRMLMKRDSYCRDIFELSDEEWAFQMDIIWDTCRLTEILNQNDGGTAFIPYIHKLDPSEKADFTKERYWLWDKKQHFDWTNRKRIQFMRDLYENLTVEIPRMKLKNS